MSDLDLDAIEARANAATSGPWEFFTRLDWVLAGTRKHAIIRSLTERNSIYPGLGKQVLEHESWYVLPAEADLAFIAAAREDVPALIAEVRRLRAQQQQQASALPGRGEG